MVVAQWSETLAAQTRGVITDFSVAYVIKIVHISIHKTCAASIALYMTGGSISVGRTLSAQTRGAEFDS